MFRCTRSNIASRNGRRSITRSFSNNRYNRLSTLNRVINRRDVPSMKFQKPTGLSANQVAQRSLGMRFLSTIDSSEESADESNTDFNSDLEKNGSAVDAAKKTKYVFF